LLEFFAQKSQQELAAQRAETYSERVSEALSTYLDTQIKLDSLLDDYNEAVYEDEDVTNINQQQLRSTEFNFIVLSYIARQNQEIILLLSSLP
jgi:restriction endonuclease Mrr